MFLPSNKNQDGGDAIPSAPSPKMLASTFDRILGRVLSGHLFTLFENVANSLAAMIQDMHFSQSNVNIYLKKSKYIVN